ncbi:MAG: NUDIX hydrolase [Planctomycetales bacterium]|nr:NUDIX hydrolase [Planctomycetales bacterium]MBN8627150.1 NUDIX hydrolase [Planctomycetota bacterium]
MNEAQLISTKKLTKEKWLNLFQRTFRYGGRTVKWLFASRKSKHDVPREADAVLIVPILIDGVAEGTAEPKLIATREWRVPIWDHEWGVPAGLVEAGEPVEEAARRELLEETGYELVDVHEVSPLNYSSTGMTDEAVVMIFCTCRTPADFRQRLDGAEQIEVHPLTIADVAKLVNTDEPINGRAWMVMYMYHRLGRFLEAEHTPALPKHTRKKKPTTARTTKRKTPKKRRP